MSCCALKANYRPCRNWSMLDKNVCLVHSVTSPHVLKDRWFKRYILGYNYTLFNYENEWYPRDQLLGPLRSAQIVLTDEDILKIPSRERYIDIYLLLLENGFIKRGFHKGLESTLLYFHCFLLSHFPDSDPMPRLRKKLEELYILSSGKVLFDFLMWMATPLVGRPHMKAKFLEYIPTLLDTPAAKELSWFPRAELDTIRLHYEKVLGADSPTVCRCLVERWLPDLKELYQTEKAIQKCKMDHCKEELMMDRWHPDRILAFLEAGIDPDDM